MSYDTQEGQERPGKGSGCAVFQNAVARQPRGSRAYILWMSKRQLEFPEQILPDELRRIAEEANVSLENATAFTQWLRDTKADMEDPSLQE